MPPKIMRIQSLKLSLVAAATTLAWTFPATAASSKAPAGFTPLFNGKDLSGWYGWTTRDPAELWAMTPEQQADFKKKSIEGGLVVK